MIHKALKGNEKTYQDIILYKAIFEAIQIFDI